MQLTLEETAQRLKTCGDAEILIHQSPDGDCIGAGMALAAMLRQMGKRARVCCADPIPARYHFLQILPESEPFEPNCILSVDVADSKLLGTLQERYAGRVALSIDHHISHVPYAEAEYLNSHAAATCQILYDLAQLLPVTLTDDIARCLYTGIVTDTGCFQFDNVSPGTHRVAAALMEQCPNVRYAWINRQMFAIKSMGRLRLEQILIDRMEQYFDGKCSLICVTQDLIREFQLDESELDGIAGFPLQVEGAEVGITMKEKDPGKFRVSMRSADQVDVSQICQLLGGGGHLKAAGCLVRGTAEQARNKLLHAVAEGLKMQ